MAGAQYTKWKERRTILHYQSKEWADEFVFMPFKDPDIRVQCYARHDDDRHQFQSGAILLRHKVVMTPDLQSRLWVMSTLS